MSDIPQEVAEFDPTSPDRWERYFRTRRVRIDRENAASKARKKHFEIRDVLDEQGNVVGTEEIPREPPYEVLETGKLVTDLDTLPQTPKRLARRAREKGWGIRASVALVEIKPVLFVNANENHEAGDVRYAGYTTHAWGLYGGLATDDGDPVASFRAFYDTRLDERGGTAFDHAWSTDLLPGQDLFREFYGKGESKAFEAWFDVLVPKPQKKTRTSHDSQEER